MRQSLGKGLQSLIPKKQSKIESLVKGQTRADNWTKTKKESIFNVEVDKIRPNPHQPRQEPSKESLKELADSIIEHGVLQPLIVTKIEKPTERGRQVEYELMAGERRWRAAQMAGLPHVPVIIRDSSEQYEKLEIALVENIQRENLNPIEAALAFKQLHHEFGLTHQEVAKRVGKSRVLVSNALRILTLPLKIQNAIASGQISEGHGRALLVAKPVARLPLFQKVIKNNISVHATEDMAKILASPDKPKGQGPKNPLFRKIEEDLGQVIGHRVSVGKRGEMGYLIVRFSGRKELDKLVGHLLKIR